MYPQQRWRGLPAELTASKQRSAHLDRELSYRGSRSDSLAGPIEFHSSVGMTSARHSLNLIEN